jgi:hypothetical protein
MNDRNRGIWGQTFEHKEFPRAMHHKEAQRVRRARKNEPGTAPRRTPFCASSLEVLVKSAEKDAYRRRLDRFSSSI